MYNKILCAIDGSETSLKALEHAVDLSSKYDAELLLLSVVNQLSFPFAAEYGLWAKESHEAVTRMILESLNSSMTEMRLQKPELKVDAEIKEGRPASVIVETALEGNFDLLVIGRNGYGLVERLVMGSVSSEVVNTCTKPVLIVNA